MRFQLVARDAVWLYALEWDLNEAKVKGGRNCDHGALATAQYPKEGSAYMLLNSTVPAALAAVNLQSPLYKGAH